jgi:thiosulfate dehydrogenase [quinone] large subunit
VLARLGPGDALGVVAAICTHCGARLQPRADAGETLRCPADGSAFGAANAAVLQGPATIPIPRFEARRAADEGVEVRAPAVA